MSLVHEDSTSVSTFFIPWTYLIGGAAAVTAFILLSKKLRRDATHSGTPLPPGPPATWFWQDPMPKENVVQGLTALVEQYGPVISLRRGSQVTIVIGRMEAAAEIMEKEGAALADRPHLVSASEILSGGMRLLLTPVGDRFRRLRRAAHTHLQPTAATAYDGIQTEAAKDLVFDLLNDPKQHTKHALRYATAVILRVTYGKTSPTSADDPEVVRVRQVLVNLEKAIRPGAYLVDRIPWLKYVPGYGRELSESHRFELSLFREQLSRVKDDMARNNAGPSFAKTLLQNTGDHQLSYDEMAYLAGALFGASSDATASGITAMIMAAACYPEAQARVQEELDEVVGNDRVPTFGDWDILPQLQAFILEALRWTPITPLGFAHRAMRDIIWRGQCIPSGATVIGCHWVISRDPAAFPDPETFNPQRWITEDGLVRMDGHFYTFGFGRRVCPGQYVANRSLFITLALLLWSFRVLQRPEAPIDPHSSDSLLIVFHPKPFEVEFVPRVEEQRLKESMARHGEGEGGSTVA